MIVVPALRLRRWRAFLPILADRLEPRGWNWFPADRGPFAQEIWFFGMRLPIPFFAENLFRDGESIPRDYCL